MNLSDALLKEANNWLRQVAKDLHAAELLLSAEPSRSLFFSQQAAEKAAKRFWPFGTFRFGRRTISKILDCNARNSTADWYRSLPRLPTEAERALALATKLCDEIQRRIGA